MKMTYIVIGIIITIGLIIYLTSCGNKSTASDKDSSENIDTTKIKDYQTKYNTFADLRSMAFKAAPEQLGITLPTDKTIVYGIIMDWEMGGATASTVSYQSGDASMYLSTGGGVIGGGPNPSVNSAAKLFVSKAQTYLDKTTKTDSTTLPDKNFVKFYLLTNKGIYVGQEDMKNFENNTSTWLELFEEGNKVISELRSVTESK